MTDRPTEEPGTLEHRGRAPMVSLAAINTVQQALREAEDSLARGAHGADPTRQEDAQMRSVTYTDREAPATGAVSGRETSTRDEPRVPDQQAPHGARESRRDAGHGTGAPSHEAPWAQDPGEAQEDDPMVSATRSPSDPQEANAIPLASAEASGAPGDGHRSSRSVPVASASVRSGVPIIGEERWALLLTTCDLDTDDTRRANQVNPNLGAVAARETGAEILLSSRSLIGLPQVE